MNVAHSLNVLTALLGERELERIDGQNEAAHIDYAPPEGPWVCVDFTDGSKFAIWKENGNIYRIGPTGAVDDDPVIAWREDGTPVLGGVEL